MPTSKSRQIIEQDDVPRVFDAACIERLAKIAKLPTGADLARFGAGIRDAACILARDARTPNDNQVHDEIGTLCKLADPYREKPAQWERIAVAVENLSLRAREMLAKRGPRPSVATKLPAPGALRDPKRREEARAAIFKLCQFGGGWGEGRRRGGKRSRTWRPLLYAPQKQKHFPKRKAERDFVMWLQIVWAEATGEKPALTARHVDASRELGPFAKFVRKCLDVVGARDADVVGQINELARRRRYHQERIDSGQASGR